MKASILLLTILGMIAINVVTGGPIEDPKQEASSENINRNGDISHSDVHSRRKRSNGGSSQCVAWRQTGGCSPDGPRETINDQDCSTFIGEGWSGYCECVDGKTALRKTCEMDGGTTCETACRAAEGSEFQCKNGKTIRASWRCDTNDDCGDNSDEQNCAFVIVAPETVCSDIGKPLISSFAECLEAASSLGLTYEKTGSWGFSPKGCYKSNYDGRVYWNTHKTGMKNQYISPICRTNDFAHTDNGFTCSDSGFRDLSTAEECSDAVSYAKSFNSEATFMGSHSVSYRPKGCYIWVDGHDGQMYFNQHPTGSSSSSIASICRKG